MTRPVALTILFATACTAPNPAFGDATSDTPTSTDATSDAPQETSSSIGDTTRGDDDTTSTTGNDPSIATSDDENSVSDSDPIHDLGDDDGSTTESAPRRAFLFTAAIDGGAFGDPAAEDLTLTGVEQCGKAYSELPLDVCDSQSVPLIRADLDPFEHPALVESLDVPVVSIDGDAIAETLQMFFDGDWILQTLYDTSGGGLEQLAQTPFATGGRTDGDPNCSNWLDAADVMTIGDPDGEEGWFAVDEVSCETPARILCVCVGN